MYKIIKVAACFGAPTRGIDKGPDAILDSLKIDDAVEIKVPRYVKSDEYPSAKNLPEVRAVCSGLLTEVKKALKEGSTPLVLQGDDSSSIGTCYALYQSLKEPFGVIYLDAHADINTPETTISGQLGGQGLAHVIGLGHPKLLELNNNHASVNPQNLVLIGQRNLDRGEIKLVHDRKITIFSPAEVRELKGMFEKIKNKFDENRIKKLYLHIDQDVVDPLISGASSSQEPNGISDKDLFAVVEFVTANFELCAISLSNYFPYIDKDKRTLRIIQNVLKIIMCEQRR